MCTSERIFTLLKLFKVVVSHFDTCQVALCASLCVLVFSGMPPRRGQFGHDAGYAEACSDWGHGCKQQAIASEILVPAPRRKSLAALVTEASCRTAARKKSLRPSTEEPEWFRNEARFELVQSADRRFMRCAPSVRGAGVGNRVWGMGNVQFGMVSHMRCTHCKRDGLCLQQATLHMHMHMSHVHVHVYVR